LFDPFIQGTPGYVYPSPVPTTGMTEKQERRILEDEAAALEERLEEIRRRLTGLRK
jgi:division protein CdvB (Snf7/Vps24/ESCRT-III family)